MSLRIAIAAVGFLGAVFAPPWVTLACIILLSLRYRAWEVIMLGLVTDLFWLPGGPSAHMFPLFTIIALIIVWGLEPLRLQFLE